MNAIKCVSEEIFFKGYPKSYMVLVERRLLVDFLCLKIGEKYYNRDEQTSI